jgi:hypothetical protein
MADRRERKAGGSPSRETGGSPQQRRVVDSELRQGAQRRLFDSPQRKPYDSPRQPTRGSPPAEITDGSLGNWAGFKGLTGTPKSYKYVEQCQVIDKVACNTASAAERQEFRDACKDDGPFRQLALSTMTRYEAQAKEMTGAGSGSGSSPSSSPTSAAARKGREMAQQRAKLLQGALGYTDEKRVIRLGVPPFSPPLSM